MTCDHEAARHLQCRDRSPAGWNCTRPLGHPGEHRACVSPTVHNLAEWPADTASKKVSEKGNEALTM